MPLYKRKSVPILPLPPEIAAGKVSPDQNVFYLRATGEIFLDYESYATRTSYLMQRIFQCAISGKRELDYFSALHSEAKAASKTTTRFPEELIPHILRACQFQVEGRLDGLIERVNERFHNRFFKGERVFIEIQGDNSAARYLGKITKIYPPAQIRILANDDTPKPEAFNRWTFGPVDSPENDPNAESYSHRIGTNLEIDAKEADRQDPAVEYLYTVQLQDQENSFEGSFMEVKNTSLSRDRLHYSKSMLKRLLRDSLVRDAQIAKPWVVRSNLSEKYGIPVAPPDEIAQKNEQFRDAKLAKRKKAPKEDPAKEEKARKRQRREEKREEAERERERIKKLREKERQEREPRKPIKYPIEDLELDPRTIHDGRVLRRVLSEVPPLPPKPTPCRDLPVPPQNFESFIMIWNMLNIFGQPLALSNFTLDDFEGCLNHDTLDPRCNLLVEIHASLLNIISTENLRLQGTYHVTATSVLPELASTFQKNGTNHSNGNHKIEDDDKKDNNNNNNGNGNANNDRDHDNMTDQEREFVIRQSIRYARGWDRSKLKSSDGRHDWQKSLIGALCQRGAIETIPEIPRILRNLVFGDNPINLPENLNDPDGNDEVNGNEENEEENQDEEEQDQDQIEEQDDDDDENYQEDKDQDDDTPQSELGDEAEEIELQVDPEEEYLSLSITDKLTILSYLCELALASKNVRGYIEECEVDLTELRKERVEINKEKKFLLTEKQNLIEKKNAAKDGKEANGTTNGAGANNTNENPGTATKENSPATEANSTMDIDENESTLQDTTTAANTPEPEQNGSDDDQINETNADEEEDEDEEDDEVDELASEDGATGNGTTDSTETGSNMFLNPAKRRATLEEKRKKREAEAAERARAREERIKSDRAENTLKRRIKENEKEFDILNKKSEDLDREFRKFRDVARVRPLGKDRFHNRFFYFDGVGTMPHIGNNGLPLYWTGRLYVQGPSPEDWAIMSSQIDEETLKQKRIDEEGQDVILGVGEWGFYDEDDQIECLLNWLNTKGNRESILKNSLRLWRPFIVHGANKRKIDLEQAPPPPAEARRSTRAAAAVNTKYYSRRYMTYTNRWAKP